MLCVIAKIDNAATERLQELCKIAEEFGLPVKELHGHITLISYIGPHETRFIQQCKNILRHHRSFAVHYHGVEVLRSTPNIVALPELSQELITLHHALASTAPSELDSWSSTTLWRPHTTLLSHTEADLQAIAQVMHSRFTPFSAQVFSVEFSKVNDNGYDIIDSIQLA